MILNQPVIDSLSLATQFGRLDFISAVLASLAVILVFGGVFSFLNFRNIAKEQATKEAAQVAEEIAEKTAVLYLERELPDMIDNYYELVKSQFVDNENSVGYSDAQHKDDNG